MCMTCVSPYTLTNGSCILSIVNCVEIDMGGCISCINGYYPSPNGESCIQQPYLC